MKPKDYNSIISGALFSDGKKWIRRHALSAWLVALAASVSLGGNTAMANGGAGGDGGGAGGVDNPTGAGGAGGNDSSGGGGGGGAGITGGSGGSSTWDPTAGGVGGAAPGAAGTVGGSGSGGGGGGGGAHGFTGAALPGAAATGGAGGVGGVGSSWDSGGGGAGGWGAVVGGAGNLGSLAVGVSGGAGGAGGANYNNDSGGDGGSGGVGLAFNGGAVEATIDSAVAGGVGGAGGYSSDWDGGNGGSGGAGLTILGGDVILTLNSAVTGAAGGAGGSSSDWDGGNGGSGGAGLTILGGSLVVTINSAVTGAVGGGGGSSPWDPGANGAGGAGLIGAGLTITMGTTGTISGGSGANAITFTGGSNFLTFNGATSGLTGNIGNNGTLLTFNQPTDVTVSNNITGTGGLAKDGLGTLTLSGTNTYTGATTINNGTLALSNGNAIANTGAVSLANTSGAILLLNNSETIGSLAGGGTTGGNVNLQGNTLTTGDASDTSFGGIISGSGGLIKQGLGTLTLSGANTYTGGTTLNQGTLTISSAGGLGATTGRLSVNNTNSSAAGTNAVLNLVTTADTTVGSLSGTISTPTSGTNTATINNGGLGRNFTVNQTSAGTYQGVIAGAGSFTLGSLSTNTLTLTGTNNYSGTTTISAGTLQIGNGGTTGSLSTSSAITNNGTLIFNQSDTVTQGTDFSGAAITGSGGLTQAGSGTLTLNAANTYTGTTTISAGILQVNSNNALGTNAAGTSVTSGAAIVLNGVTYSTAEALSINGTGVLNGGALVNSGTSSYAGQITAATNASINAGGGTLTLSGGLVKSGTTLTLTGGGNINVTGVISGNTGSFNSDLVVNGVTANLDAANTYLGPTYITSIVAGDGILNANVANALPTTNGRTSITMDATGAGGSALNIGGTILYPLGANQSIASLAGAGASIVTLGSNTLTIGYGTGLNTNGTVDAIFAGVISGTGSLIKDDVSKQILTGANTYTGTTTISAGTLQIGNGGTTGSLSTLSAITNNGTLTFNQTDTVTQGTDFSGAAITGSGGLTQAGSGTLTLNAANAYTGATTISAGTLQIGNGGTTGSLSTLSAITNNGTLTFNQTDTVTQGVDFSAAAITGTGALIQNGSGNLILNAANTYAGGTTVRNGSLTVSGGGAINHSAANLTIGLNSGEIAALTVNTGSVTANELYVGYTGNGVLNLSNGTITNTKGFIGVNSPSVSSANITGGQWDNTDVLTVGYGGRGSLAISGTGTVNSAGAYFGFLAASDGNIATIAGPGASWTSDNTFYLGHDGSNNTVTVSGGALLANNNVANTADFLIGSNAGSDNNKLTVTGTDSRFTNNGTLYVGRNGTGNQFEVLAGGSATSRNVRIGGGTGSNPLTPTVNNAATVDGAGSLWNVTGTMRIGSSGDNSSLTISNGGSVTTTGNSFLGYDLGSDNNQVTITGANSTWTANNLTIGRLGVNNTVTVANGGTLSATNILLGDQLGSSGALQIGTGSAATVLAAQISEGLGEGTVTFNNGTLRLTGAQANLFSGFETDDVTLGSGGGTIDTQAFSVATGYALSGAGGLTKQGTGTLTLSGANTYTGGTTLNQGTLTISSAGGLGATTGILSVNNTNTSAAGTNAVLNLVTTADTTVGSLSGSISTPTSGTNTATINNGGVGRNFTVNQTSAGTYQGVIAGAGSFTLGSLSTNTLTLTGVNTYTGTTTINAGTLRLNSVGTAIATDNDTLTTSDIVINGGTLELAANEQIANSGSINMSSGAFNFGLATNLTETIDKFTNSGGTFSTGDNTLIGLGNTITWSGGTNTVNDGGNVQDIHLVISGGTNTVQGGATGGVLQLNAGGLGLEMSNGVLLTLNSDNVVAGKLLLKGNVSSSGNTTVTIAHSGAATYLGNIDLDGGTRTFTIANGTAATDMLISAVITNGGLTKEGAGTLALSGANTYTGTTTISAGILELTGSLASPTVDISSGATLYNVNGGFDDFAAVTNAGTLRLGAADTVLSLSNTGLIDITDSVFSGSDLGFVAGAINLNAGSSMLLSNSILEIGEIADIFDGTITGSFSGISDGSDLRFSMNYTTGEIQGLPGLQRPNQYSNTIYNLNRNQTWTAGALFEDTYTSVPVDTNFRKVYFDAYGPSSNVVAGPTEFFAWDMDPGTGLDADPALAQLVSAMTAIQSTYSVALDGSILVGAAGKAIIDQLSPEVHRGMVDYTEQALRSHVRDGVDAAPISKIGKTQVFATLQTSDQGVDTSDNNANYDLDMVSLTTGVRYDIDKRFQIGGLLGMDDGSIEGALVDTDAQGIVGGIFGRYLVDEASNTRVTASASYGSFDYDSNRHSFGGDADADSIGSDAFELALGVSTVAFKKDGFRVIPNATLRYMDGSVDGFEEDGPGIALRVEEQDLNSVLLDLGVDFEYQAQKNLLLIGRIGYVTDFEDSDNSVGARFAASGPDASPFTVSAPGIEDEAFVLGLGTYYDFNENTRVGLTYRGEFRTHSEYTQSIGIGASFGF